MHFFLLFKHQKRNIYEIQPFFRWQMKPSNQRHPFPLFFPEPEKVNDTMLHDDDALKATAFACVKKVHSFTLG